MKTIDDHTPAPLALRICAGKFGEAVARMLSEEQSWWHNHHGPSIVGMPISNYDLSEYGAVATALRQLGVMHSILHDDGIRRVSFALDATEIAPFIEGSSGHGEASFLSLILRSIDLIDAYGRGNGRMPWPTWGGDLQKFGPSDFFEPPDHCREAMIAAVPCGLAEEASPSFRWTPKMTQIYIEDDLGRQARQRISFPHG
ncbi:hypothetical protein VVT58_10780 [Sphingobium sp. SJ10-10]|uniref:hypothetical protein n=1 Tax=Sphingobium sp. SJ10-10 TaxID=3114999 RepID=UPI002E183683|nr:hypothetical protein [Sphingobium sp. SJ10-10]